MMEPAAPFVYVDTPAALQNLAAQLEKAGQVALDAEADSLHHYHYKTCLIQLTFNEQHFIVDPLAAIDLTALMTRLAAKPLIIHDADYDLRMLRADFGFRPANEVLDTMQAAQLLGYEQFGLAALILKFFDVTLPKDGKKFDWSRRPLPPKMLAYAYNDTRYLPRLSRMLDNQLTELGRTQWHRETCQAIVRATGEDTQRDPEHEWRRLKGLGKLESRQLAFVRQLWLWRDSVAQSADRPPFKIMGNQDLTGLALWCSSHSGLTLDQGPKLPRHIRGRRLAALKRAIAQAQALPAAEWPPRRRNTPAKPYQPVDPAWVDRLRNKCAKVAGQLNLPPAVLASRARLTGIIRDQPATLEEMMASGPLLAWQAQLLEPAIREVLDNMRRRRESGGQ